MDSNAQAILEPSLLGFLNVMQAGKDHTFIGELLPAKKMLKDMLLSFSNIGLNPGSSIYHREFLL